MHQATTTNNPCIANDAVGALECSIGTLEAVLRTGAITGGTRNMVEVQIEANRSVVTSLQTSDQFDAAGENQQNAARVQWLRNAFNHMKTSSSEIFVDLLRIDIDPIRGDVISGIDAAIAKLPLDAQRALLNPQEQQQPVLDSPGAVREYLLQQIAPAQPGTLYCLPLDSQHKVLGVEAIRLADGEVIGVTTREIVRRVLPHRAAAIVFAGAGTVLGVLDALRAVRVLKDAMHAIDVRVVDFFVFAGREEAVSFAERGVL